MFKLEEAKPVLFEFTYKGKKYGIPTADSLPFSTFMRIRSKMREDGAGAEAGFDEIMAVFEEHAPEVMASINMNQAKELFVAYTSAGTASLGE